MKHELAPHVRNSTFDYLISEYVRYEDDRGMLRDHYFRGKSFMDLSKIYDCSLTHVKDVIYGIGDPLLIMAAEMDA